MSSRIFHPRPLLLLAGLAAGPSALAEEAVRFGRDVLPILSAKCFACHGPDEHERKADLRLDTREGALALLDDGAAVVPGDPAKSQLLARILSTDPDEVMPPPKTGKPVRPEEAAVLKRWIAEGAPWGRHWSFEPLTRPAPPAAGHPVDAFVNARLARAGITPAPPADRRVLLRRLALDLTGLPPTPEEADAFASDPAPDAYERRVDEWLARPTFGEHWARMWLDIARYADTKGYEKDRGRTMWPYRDWVVDAFNRDLPLDRFTEEQLAGDLIPGGSIIATAFHRNTMSNDEGGTDDEEFRVAAVKDRVDTTVQAWMGLTMGCAKCHSHKYDPISIGEYYAFYALFNQTEDADRGDDAPTQAVQTPAREAERKALEAKMDEARQAAERAEQEDLASDPKPWRLLPVVSARSEQGATLTVQADGSVLAGGAHPDRDIAVLEVTVPAGTHTALRLEALTAPLSDGRRTVGRSKEDPNFVVSEFTVEREGQAVLLAKVRADFEQNGWAAPGAADGKRETGWAVSPNKEEPHAVIFAFREPLTTAADTTLRIRIDQNYGHGLTLHRFRLSTTGEDAAKAPFFPKGKAGKQAEAALAKARSALKAFDDATPRLPIMRELPANKQRVTRVHKRGSFLDPGEEVKPGLPAAFHALRVGAPLDRRGVAQWLVSPENPLTPRVWANRFWARLFGVGLVETEEDFGALGTPPSHPELLDWLAVEYRDQGWSLKKFLRTVVTSETYRRSSVATPGAREADPRNRLLGRGARHRLPAEVVRDQALAIGGLLSLRQGGPPVMPPQPAGLWRSAYSGNKWEDAQDENRWRRGIYTYWKRTTPYPSLLAFDAGSREVCQLRRIHTNTPLQALVTLNDPVYLEAAAGLARRVVQQPGDDASRLRHGLRLTLAREPAPGEEKPLLELLERARRSFAADAARAAEWTALGRVPTPERITPVEFAAWMVAGNALLNLDEGLSRP